MKLRLVIVGCKKKRKKRGSDARGDGTTETLNDKIYYAEQLTADVNIKMITQETYILQLLRGRSRVRR